MPSQVETTVPHVTEQRDVVVVGAGQAGSAIAAGLAQRGWDVLLLERDRLPRHKVCGEFLSPEAQHSLDALNLLQDAACLRPVPLHGAAITTPRGVNLEMPLPAPAWGISRHALDAGLAAGVERCGGTVRQGAKVTRVARTGPKWVVAVRTGGVRMPECSVEARAVIIACGRHSAAGLPPHSPAQLDARAGWRNCVGLKTHYIGVTMPPQVELYLFPGGYVGINPIEGGRANVCVLITYAAFQAAGRSLRCVLEIASARHPALTERLRGAHALAETECAVAPVDTHRTPVPWDAEQQLPCLGDTAAMIPPLAGDGMAMALRSAELCLDPVDAYLRGTLSLAEWQSAYTQRWHAEFGRRLRLGQALQSALTTRGLGDTLAAIGQRLPWAAAWLLAGTRGRMA